MSITEAADSLIKHAVVKVREHEGTWFAFVPQIAHVAFENGKTQLDALAKLRISIVQNIDRVMQAWKVLGA